MVTVSRWTGRHARVLREVGLRMSIYEFAAHTSLSTSTIREMEAKGERAQLRTSTQKILDEALAGASEPAQRRFAAALDTTGRSADSGTIGHVRYIRRDLEGLFHADGKCWIQRLTPGLAADVRSAVEERFDDGLPYTEQLERLRESVDGHAVQVAAIAPGEMINRLAADLATAYHLLRYTRTRAHGVALRSALAKISVMIADELSVLGSIEAAHGWYLTAIAAADRSDSTQLQAAVRALAAMLPLYHGRQGDVIQIARQVRHIAGAVACFATAVSSMFEALARARLGDHDHARQVLHEARTVYDRMDSGEQAESFFGLSVRRRMFYEGRILTTLGDYAAAEAAHRQARALYPPQVVGDPTIMDFDRATALINSGEFEAGAGLIASTLSKLPADHQGGIFLSLATRAFDAIPARARRLPAPRACADLLDGLSNGQWPAVQFAST